MKKHILYFGTILFVLLIVQSLSAQNRQKTDANIVGHVKSGGEHIPYASVMIRGTAIGTMTDATGHYMLTNLPVGKHIVRVQVLGYKPKEKEVNLVAAQTLEVNFQLEEDAFGMEEVVVTGNRSADKKSESPVIINTVSPKLFSAIQSTQVREGLNFCPGLRTETDCQNCGFNQLRINGMGGAYSQILINSRPVFSALAGVYGLELIPANMIDRIEVIRGGGSVLYGSNAIAGSVNIILKDPVENTFSIVMNQGWTGRGINKYGQPSSDFSLQANSSVTSNDHKAGLALYGYYHTKDPYDANGDGFSELPELSNVTFGFRGFHRLGYRSKINMDFFNIREERRGGNAFELPVHEADIAEAVKHNITSGSLTYNLFLRKQDQFSAFISFQRIDRDSYYGAWKSLKDYGHTDNLTYVSGVQYKADFNKIKLIGGAELRGETLNDKKLGYPDYEHAMILNDSIISVPHVPDTPVARQNSVTAGSFVQINYSLPRWIFSAGLRYDNYFVTDEMQAGEDQTGQVLSPKLNVKFDMTHVLQIRANMGTGYRVPQVFNEDLHILTSGSRQVHIVNDPALKQENSRSYSLSLYLHGDKTTRPYEFLAEGFYTHLLNPFVNTIGLPDENGVVYYTRKNAENGAVVYGMNLEFNIKPYAHMSLRSGLTLQRSDYQKPQDFNERRFLRTPDSYGYAILDYNPVKSPDISLTYNYTGKMLVPYFGTGLPDADAGELRQSHSFHNAGVKVRYTFTLNGTKMQVYVAVKNILNSYQKDFDTGINRDPGYIYGPAYPQSVYFGIKFGNNL
ncbi:MAG: TonB-dependent receptor [Chlorobi bacterium]|nr:TonB-dependent receptor [Chlorobiota bacterium]